MKISIAMCSCNGSEFIGEQLESLARQNTQPSELVVCDDGSTDKTIQLIEEFRSQAPFPVRLYRNEENLRFTGNFFKAASLCRGEGIAFCDQDDIWEPNKLAICSRSLEVEQSDLVIHEGRVIDSAGQRTGLRIPDLSAGSRASQEVPYEISKGFAMVVRSEVVTSFMQHWDWSDYLNFKRRFGAPMGHDVLIYGWCVGRRRVSFVREELVCYRVHGRNQTATADIVRPRLSRLGSFFRKLNFDPASYRIPGVKWGAEADFLKRYLSRCNHKSPSGLEKLQVYLEHKSSLWIRRASLYEPKCGRRMRLRAFANLVRSGAYLPGREPTLGLRGIMKDLAVTLAR